MKLIPKNYSAWSKAAAAVDAVIAQVEELPSPGSGTWDAVFRNLERTAARVRAVERTASKARRLLVRIPDRYPIPALYRDDEDPAVRAAASAMLDRRNRTTKDAREAA